VVVVVVVVVWWGGGCGDGGGGGVGVVVWRSVVGEGYSITASTGSVGVNTGTV
jgi:hypothetical protein